MHSKHPTPISLRNNGLFLMGTTSVSQLSIAHGLLLNSIEIVIYLHLIVETMLLFISLFYINLSAQLLQKDY